MISVRIYIYDIWFKHNVAGASLKNTAIDPASLL